MSVCDQCSLVSFFAQEPTCNDKRKLKKAMTNRTKNKFTSHCRIAVKTNFFLLLFPTHFAHARYSSRMIDRFLNCGDHGKLKSGKIKGHCQPPCPMQDEEILLRCVGALCFSEYCGNCWNSTVKSIHFVVFN